MTQSSSAWAFMKAFDIKKDGDLYLHRRRIIQTPWFAIYLHRIYREDRDRHLHDHPWNFTAWVLRGGYTEVVQDSIAAPERKRNLWRRWSWHRMRVDQGHMITSVEPGTVTLVLCGRRQREWGFWTEEGFMHYQPYLNMAQERGWTQSS